MIRWKAFTFYMPNAIPEIVRLQKQVFDSLNEPLEQVLDTCSHGQFLTRTLRNNVETLDVVVFFDLDCIPLKSGVVKRAVNLSLKHNMVFGCAQQANYIEEIKLLKARRSWPILLRKLESARYRFCKFVGIDPFSYPDPLIYAGPCFLVVPTKIYKLVGEPNLEGSDRTDVAGELTIACREKGIKVHCFQPTHCHVPKYKLGKSKRYGLGTTYGRCVFHAFETTYLSNKKSAALFQQYCQKTILKARSEKL